MVVIGKFVELEKFRYKLFWDPDGGGDIHPCLPSIYATGDDFKTAKYERI